MTNDLNERRSMAVIVAAIVTTFVFLIGGLTTGLICAVQKRHEASPEPSKAMAQYLLVDSAGALRNSMSALRLCNESEPAEKINRTALVHAVRAETALECHTDDWADNRDKEAFLNDISTVLHSYDPLRTVEMSETLYELSDKFYNSVSNGEAFEYDGELIEKTEDGGHDVEITDEDIQAGKELVAQALDCSRVEYVGAWEGHIEYFIEREGKTGYAVVCGEKIIEFSYIRDEQSEPMDTDEASVIAVETAKRCGYDGLSVKWCEVTGKSVTAILCRSYDGAMAGDDCATVIMYGGVAVAFNAGHCDREHGNIPERKVDELSARKAAKDGGTGVLVVRVVDGKERICYEYRYELEDGVHYVYVCAESGKQMEVK